MGVLYNYDLLRIEDIHTTAASQNIDTDFSLCTWLSLWFVGVLQCHLGTLMFLPQWRYISNFHFTCLSHFFRFPSGTRSAVSRELSRAIVILSCLIVHVTLLISIQSAFNVKPLCKRSCCIMETYHVPLTKKRCNVRRPIEAANLQLYYRITKTLLLHIFGHAAFIKQQVVLCHGTFWLIKAALPKISIKSVFVILNHFPLTYQFEEPFQQYPYTCIFTGHKQHDEKCRDWRKIM